jgi:hypothetical protein
VDFDNSRKGFGPGVNKVISTGSNVMVGRVVGVNDGMGVLVGAIAPACNVLVGASVLIANGSGVCVYVSEINVTVD